MDLTPVKNIQITEERLAGGLIMIRYPMTLRPWLARVFNRLGYASDENRYKKLQLDDLGTEVWGMINDVRSVRRMTEIFAESHRLPLREAEIAITQFLRDLGRRGIIGLR